MYREVRAPEQLSTPAMWAGNLAGMSRLTTRRRLGLALDHRWRLIQRWVPNGPIVDAGCGAGDWVAFLNSQGRDSIGLDYSPELLDRCRAWYPSLRWDHGDIEALPYTENSLAGVVSWGVIEHREHGPGPALREFCRVVRPGGAIVVTVPRDSLASRRARDVMTNGPVAAGEFFQYYLSEQELRELVRAAGFEVVACGTCPSATLAYVAPRFYQRWHRTKAWHAGELLTQLACAASDTYRNMIYCVGQKPQAAIRAAQAA